MSTSTVMNADGFGGPGMLRTGSGRPGSDQQRLVRFIAVSLAVHVLLLAILRLPTDPESLAFIPDLFIHIEMDGARDTESTSPQPVEQPQPQQVPTRSSEPLVTERAEPERAADVPAIPHAEETNPAPPQEGLAHVESVAETPVVQPESSSEEPVLTTTGPSELQHHSGAEEAVVQREPDPVPIPGEDQEVLSRKVIQGIQTLQATDAPQLRLSWQDGEQVYVATLTRQPATDGMDIERATVEIETEHNGERLRTQMQMKRLAFSHFTQLIDRWDREVQLHDDIITGRFHSNSEIVVGYDRKVAPLFQGKVTTAARGFSFARNIGHRRRDEIFPQGLETRAGRIRFPDKLLGPLSEHASSAVVHSIEGDAHLTFFAEGSYGVMQPDADSSEIRRLDPDAPTYILGEPNSTLHVSGVVRGKVLVYSPQRIVIKGDLTYSRDPRKSDSDDYLGLVSDKYIEVASPRVTGPGDLEVYAAVYAKRRFDVNRFESRPSGTLFIYGSLTAGTISATEPRYATTIEFDPRFESIRPPGFPLTNRYEIETWDPQWQRVEPAKRTAAFD